MTRVYKKNKTILTIKNNNLLVKINSLSKTFSPYSTLATDINTTENLVISNPIKKRKFFDISLSTIEFLIKIFLFKN